MWRSDRILPIKRDYLLILPLCLLDALQCVLPFVSQLVFSFSHFLDALIIDITASNAMWDEVVRLNAEFGIGDIGSPHPHTPPSSSALEVDPVS